MQRQPQPTTNDQEAPRLVPAVRAGSSNLFWLGFAVVVLATAGFLALVSSDGDNGQGDVLTIPFTTEDSGTASLQDFTGQPLVVNFFASWCPPCRAELPDLEAVFQANAGQVAFLGINHDFDDTTWRAFVEESAISYPTGFQPGAEIWNAIGGQGMPTTILISPDGEVVRMHTGLLTAKQLQAMIDESLLART